MRRLVPALALSVLLLPASAQVTYSVVGSTYQQNFNSLPNSGGPIAFVNDGTLPGWYIVDRNGSLLLGGSPNIRPDAGGSASETLFSYGSSPAPDRALGLIPGVQGVYNFPSSGQIAAYIGMVLTNATTVTLSRVTVSFAAEQWRLDAAGPYAVGFAYAKGATSFVSGSFTTVPELQFSTPVSNGPNSGINVDGNVPPNRTALSHTITGVNWLPGQTLWLRCAIPAAVGSSHHGIALDDLSVQATEEPPEIEVRQPRLSIIADGGIKNFGAVTVNGNTSLVFTIKNTGAGDLTGLGMSFDGPDSGVFSVTAPPVAPVSGPTGSTTFTVQFAPTSVGPKTAVLHLANNDTDENPYDITLLGNVSAQEVWRQTNFGSIQNSGDGADLNDYERDGLVNLVEFAFGLNPKQNSAGQLPQGQIIGPNYVIFFNQPSGVSGVTYGAEWSTSLMPLEWTPITDTGTPPQHVFSVPIGSNTRMFTRYKVSSP